jgi:hypothetical protein
MNGSGELPTEYSFSMLRGQVDYRPNIYSMYEWVRQMTDQIFIGWMNRSGGLLTEYSLDVCRGQVDYRPNINSVYT